MQQVTACSKAKQSEWDIQEEVRKVAKEWVEEANNNNVARMLQESTMSIVTSGKSDSRQEETPTDTDEEDEKVWQALPDSKISLSLSALLKLVPHFIEKVAQIISKNVFAEVAVNFTNPIKGRTIIDEQILMTISRAENQETICS